MSNICDRGKAYGKGIAVELRHIRYFLAVHEERHLTRAAERLGIQQPPLSQQIRALETKLGLKLFRRLPKGMEPTQAGLVLYDKLKLFPTQVEQAVESARNTARGEEGRLVIGASSSAVLSPIVPRLVRRFRQAAPGVEVSLEEDSAEELVHALRQGRIDVVFTRSSIARVPDLAVRTLAEEEMFVALPGDHRLRDSAASGISLRELSQEKLILYRRPGGPGLYDAIVAACRNVGFAPNIAQEALRLPSTLNFVGAGLGVSIVPDSLRRLNVEGVVFRALTDCPELKAPLFLMWRAGNAGPVPRFVAQAESELATTMAQT
jgi:DNA-binding transcriptional LysR family regulator